MTNSELPVADQNFSPEELLEHLGHIIHNAEPVEVGGPLYARKVNFLRLAKEWIKKNYNEIRETICQSDYRSYMNHPVNDLILYVIGLLEPVFSGSIAIALAYYLCKVGLNSICEKTVDEFFQS
ncbi:MAG TPA: hypothetical protein VFS90_03875 [Pyrinomonadaceae bacterium]|nr:hypothetical protein [Pyrinomonadaceae bacterium]